MLIRRRWIFFLILTLASFVMILPLLVMSIPSNGRAEIGLKTTKAYNLKGAGLRRIYSPSISTDPYVAGEWNEAIWSLEAACREKGLYCEEARQAQISMMN